MMEWKSVGMMKFPTEWRVIIWLVVLTILKKISQWEGLSHISWKIKNCLKPPTSSPHGSLNVPIEHHPTIRYMVYNGYFFRWCPIAPKWDIYQSLVHSCSKPPTRRCNRCLGWNIYLFESPTNVLPISYKHHAAQHNSPVSRKSSSNPAIEKFLMYDFPTWWGIHQL